MDENPRELQAAVNLWQENIRGISRRIFRNFRCCTIRVRRVEGISLKKTNKKKGPKSNMDWCTLMTNEKWGEMKSAWKVIYYIAQFILSNCNLVIKANSASCQRLQPRGWLHQLGYQRLQSYNNVTPVRAYQNKAVFDAQVQIKPFKRHRRWPGGSRAFRR